MISLLTSIAPIFLGFFAKLMALKSQAAAENQKLMIEFSDYTNILIKMVNSCIKEPHSFLAVFIMSRDGTAKLDFI